MSQYWGFVIPEILLKICACWKQDAKASNGIWTVVLHEWFIKVRIGIAQQRRTICVPDEIRVGKPLMTSTIVIEYLTERRN